MKINEKGLAKFAGSGAPPDKEGYLHKRGDFNKGYQKRWFVLKGNLLFYFEKRIEKEPVGLIVMEGCTVELSDLQDGFTFMIHFHGTHSRTYVLCADTQEDMESWMKVLSVASYDYIKTCVAELQSQLEDIDSFSNKSLMTSVLKDSSNFSNHFSTCGTTTLRGKSNTNSHADRRVAVSFSDRHNPFNADDSVGNDLFVRESEKQCRTFLEMHEEFGAQIKETMDGYMIQRKETSA